MVGIQAQEALTITEAEQLAALEATIERGLRTFVDVGASLAHIRDGRLYRATHATFEDYCRERWGFARQTAYQYIAASQVAENVRNCGHAVPVTESQARPLTKLQPDAQREVWQLAVDTAPGGKVTAAHVEATVRDYTGESRPSPLPQPVSEAEWTATEKAWELCMAFWTHENGPKWAAFTTAEIMDMLGFGMYSGAHSMLERSRLRGLYRGADGKWRLMLD